MKYGWLALIMVFALLFGGATLNGYGPLAALASPGDRHDCNQIRGTGYNSGDERDWFWITCNGRSAPPVTASQTVSTNVTQSTGGETVNPYCGDRELVAMQWTQLGPNCRVHSGDLYVSRNWQDPNATILLQAGADIGLIVKCNTVCWVAPKIGGGLSGQTTLTLATAMGQNGCTGGCANIKECDFTSCVTYAAPGRGGPQQIQYSPSVVSNGATALPTYVTTAPAQTTNSGSVASALTVKTTGGANCTGSFSKMQEGTIPYNCSTKADLSLPEHGIWVNQYVNTASAAHQTMAVLCMDPNGCKFRADFGASIGSETLDTLKAQGCGTGCSVQVMVLKLSDTTPIKQEFDEQVLAQSLPQTTTCANVNGQYHPVGRTDSGFWNGWGDGMPKDICFFVDGYAVGRDGLPITTH